MSYGRRNSYNIDFKVLVVDWLRKNEGNISKAAREFDVDRKRVREWNEKYDQLKTHHVGQRAKWRKCKNSTYKCVDRSRHNEIKGAMTKINVCTNLSTHISHGTLDSVVS